MAKNTIKPEALYRVQVEQKCSAAGQNLRPGTVAVLVGTLVEELGDKVTVIDKIEG